MAPAARQPRPRAAQLTRPTVPKTDSPVQKYVQHVSKALGMAATAAARLRSASRRPGAQTPLSTAAPSARAWGGAVGAHSEHG